LKPRNNSSFVAAVALEHGRRLKRFLSQRIYNKADVSDLMQEVYLRLLRVERCEEIRSAEAYLLTIAVHLVREHKVRHITRPEHVDLDELVPSLRGRDSDAPEAHVDTEQRLRAIERALARLSPNARAVLVLHRRDGFSLDEIGARLGVSRSMVKKYLVRGLAACRQQLSRLE